MIKDVKLVDLVPHMDDRGYLIEILRASDEHFTKFGQVYIVGDMVRNTIRAFHVHKVLWDWFFISHGSAKFATAASCCAAGSISRVDVAGR
jgi:dTDP-4-dehydrorhamnose 3,5-epimerase-like enzyme